MVTKTNILSQISLFETSKEYLKNTIKVISKYYSPLIMKKSIIDSKIQIAPRIFI